MRRIFLSAGHSTVDPGATANGRRECDLAVDLRNMVALYLERAGVPFGVDGEGAENLPLAATVALTRRRDDLEVEFHCNASDNPAATGVETLSGPRDLALGARICHAIATGLGIRNRGAKPENAGHHSRLAFVGAGGIIVETLFITNRDDLAAWDARKWLAAKAIAGVLVEVVKPQR
jgi:N-acetylmuramoyl-L-alanine amidase